MPEHSNVPAPEEFASEWAVPPGELLQLELEAIGYSQADVATRAGLSAKHLNQVLRGHVPVSAEVALALEQVLDVSAELTLRMEGTWQASQARTAHLDALSKFGTWVESFPQTVLRNRLGFRSTEPVDERVDKLLRFFKVTDVEAFGKVWLAPQASYKRSQRFDINEYATALWLRLAEVEAERILESAGSFDSAALRRVAAEIPGLTRLPIEEGFAQAQGLLLECGVLLVFVPEIDGTRICGASRWLRGKSPIVALTSRHKFLDIFWFTMLHEIAHILLHPKRATYLDVEKKKGVKDDEDNLETEANRFAASLLLDDNSRAALLAATSDEDIIQLANQVGVSVGILAGQYGHLASDWRKFGRLRSPIDLGSIVGHA